MKKFASTLTNMEMALARAFEAAGLCSISQAVKAFERRDSEKIRAWEKQLKEKVNSPRVKGA